MSRETGAGGNWTWMQDRGFHTPRIAFVPFGNLGEKAVRYSPVNKRGEIPAGPVQIGTQALLDSIACPVPEILQSWMSFMSKIQK